MSQNKPRRREGEAPAEPGGRPHPLPLPHAAVGEGGRTQNIPREGEAPAEPLRRAAERAAKDPFFLAGAFQSYAAAYNLSEAGLAAALGCVPEDLPRLALCRRPAGESFRKDVEQLARRFSLRPEALANLVREVDAVQALREGAGSYRQAVAEAAVAYSGLLLAARDREEPSGEEVEP